jgi:hypothetical protein
MGIPILDNNKCSVLIAEYATGIVCKGDLTLFLNDRDNEGDAFQLFDDFSSAKEYAMNLSKERPEFECHIYDYNGNYLIGYNMKGELHQ